MVEIKEEIFNPDNFKSFRAFTEARPNLVLAPEIIKHWNTIHASSDEAWGAFRDGAGLDNPDPSYKAPPAILENSLPLPFLAPRAPGGLGLWEAADTFLHNCGFLSGDFEYFRCGREAIAFRTQGISDLLLKTSKHTDVPEDITPVLWSLGRQTFKPPVKQPTLTEEISVALVPYLDTPLIFDKAHPLLKNISLSRGQVTALETIPDNPIVIVQRLLNHLGWDFEDQKTANLRAHSDYPGIYFVTDRRAVSELPPNHPKRRVQLTDAEQKLLIVYKEVQFLIREALLSKYFPDTVRKLSKKAAERKLTPVTRSIMGEGLFLAVAQVVRAADQLAEPARRTHRRALSGAKPDSSVN